MSVSLLAMSAHAALTPLEAQRLEVYACAAIFGLLISGLIGIAKEIVGEMSGEPSARRK